MSTHGDSWKLLHHVDVSAHRALLLLERSGVVFSRTLVSKAYRDDLDLLSWRYSGFCEAVRNAHGLSQRHRQRRCRLEGTEGQWWGDLKTKLVLKMKGKTPVEDD